MTGNPVQSSPPSSPASAARCAACGEPVHELRDGRCTLCGHPIEEPDVTSDDHTPYAVGIENGRPARLAMCLWVMRAGRQRLVHLGLIRPSASSRRFALLSTLVLSLVVGLSIFINSGWHEIRRGFNAGGAMASPSGRGWVKVVEQPTSRAEGPSQPASLWWNPPRALIGGGVSLLLTAIACAILLRILAAGGRSGGGGEARRAAPNRQDGDGAGHATAAVPLPHGRGSDRARLRGAVHYSTAWMLLPTVAALILMLRPVARIGRIVGWWSGPMTAAVDVPAVIATLAGVLLWWFWLIRLAGAQPRDMRGHAQRYYLLWSPLAALAIVAAAGGGAWFIVQQIARNTNLVW